MAAQVFRQVSGASLNQARIKQIGANVKGWNIINSNAAARFVKLWFFLPGTAGRDAPVVGTDPPSMTIPIPASSSSLIMSDPSGFTGKGDLWMATTVNLVDSDATPVGAGDLVTQILYE